MLAEKRTKTLSSLCQDYVIGQDFSQSQSPNQTQLLRKIDQLQRELKNARERERKLKITNNQLTNMVHSSLTNPKNTQQFIRNTQILFQQALRTNHPPPKIESQRGHQRKHSNSTRQGTLKFNSKEEMSSSFSTGTQGHFNDTMGTHQTQSTLACLNKSQLRQRMGSLRRVESRVPVRY